MGKSLYFLALIGFCLFAEINGKTFSRCELARALKNHGFPRDKLPDWVCLVEAESSRRTDVVGGPNSDGSHDYGLFQINDRYWCSTTNNPGKDCHVRCKDLLTDDITKASNCAKKIYRIHNFNAWYGWQNKCRGKPLPDLSHCGI
ncbi:Lysozyme [Eumeta japonica]|uniref:Lysozyme n=1 Tax=Eumeta variegata TaxID=151549 RepID=A0A4C1UI88_EUMVA|nr:Lysozyme [Eumeta japonica]